MKLKKIASLMLAGIMALSMLAGCSTNGNNNEEQPPVVDPVDTTFAASVNAELSDAQKNVITFSNDATLNSVLTKVAGVLDSESMTPYYVQGFGNVFSVDAMDMRHLLGIDEENSMVFGDRLFKDNATSTVTAADIFVVDGSYTDEGVAEFVADLVGKLISEDKMPAVANGKDYRYSYTGNIACTKVTNLAGDFQSYVVAFTVTQTPTKITNNNK